MIEKALRDGFKIMKVDCDLIGVVSTPIISFYTKFHKYDFGIMISASHNPYYDNGIKIFKKNGQKLSDEEEIKKLKKKLDELDVVPKFSRLPIFYKKFDITHYNNFLTKKFKESDLSDIKVVVDCANGSVYKLAPSFFKKFWMQCSCLHSDKPNGKNINKSCGATFPKKDF